MLVLVLVLQEIQPSGPNGPVVTVGDFVRDLLLEQVSKIYSRRVEERVAKVAVKLCAASDWCTAVPRVQCQTGRQCNVRVLKP